MTLQRVFSMRQTIDAIYENGLFKPVDPSKVHVAEGQRVKLVVTEQALPEPLRLAVQVYEGLSGQEINEIEKIALDRSHFFERQVFKP